MKKIDRKEIIKRNVEDRHNNTLFLNRKNNQMRERDLRRANGNDIVQSQINNVVENFSSDIKKKVVVELPFNDRTSGGVNRMLNIAIELPKYSSTSGGIRESIKLSNNIQHNVVVRFQKLTNEYPQISNTWTVGLPDHTFSSCDVCITYSDTPYLSELIALPQVKKVLIYMLSYGMAIGRERKNVLNKNVTVMCSTKKIEDAILLEGVKVHRIGFALDMDEMYNENLLRKNYLAIMYHPSQDKKYSTAVSVADILYKNKIIDGVITFGVNDAYKNNTHPKGLVKHYPNANRDEIREIFNICKCFLMPSITEGLNLTPIESTLCGCPAILCDGAIDEIFFNRKNCFVVKSEDKNDMMKKVEDATLNFDIFSEFFENNMLKITKEYTWENVINNLNRLL